MMFLEKNYGGQVNFENTTFPTTFSEIHNAYLYML